MLAVLAESALRSLCLGGAVWIGLQLFRIRDPHVHMTSWAIVLVASLAMPLLMHWTTVTIAVSPAALPASAGLWPTSFALPDLPSALSSTPDMAGVVNTPPHRAIDWSALASAIYLGIVAVLLLRLAIGLYLTWRLVRAATPLNVAWTGNADVRVSRFIGGPVTFGSVILLPSHYGDWDRSKRQAVLAHEAAHVANRDFYLLLLASLNRAVFWFSPFAWWQSMRLAELAETISDARALEIVDDRLSYAQILLDLVQHKRQAPAGLHMARACTVRARIERILDESVVPAKVGMRKRLWTIVSTMPVVIVCALSIAYSAPSHSTATADFAPDNALPMTISPVDFYLLGSGAVLAIFQDGDVLSAQLSWQRKFRLSKAPDGTVSYPSAAGAMSWTPGDDPHPAELSLSQNGREIKASRIAARTGEPTDAATATDAIIGFYELTPTRVLTVTRDGNRIAVHETGRATTAMRGVDADSFAAADGSLALFLRDPQGGVTQMLDLNPVSGARLAPRIDAARAKAIEDAAARRLVEAPDRFTGQVPMTGSRDAVWHGITDLQNGTPNYDRMSPALAAKARRQLPQMQSILTAFGAVETVFFRGVGPGGYDIYGVKFANGIAEVRLLMGADGKADDVLFRPDGNETPGGVVACATEATLTPRGNTAPISMLIYNNSGADIYLYELNAEGRRVARGRVGDDMSSSVWTSVERPWIVADASGTCLEVLQPGQRTRVHVVESASPDGAPQRPGLPRTTPLAGSEAMLRDYIETLGRGEPDYTRMTAEVAAQTRQQLTLNRAILGKLGALHALSFRGVSGLGSDIYMVHFANGTAEWRIGLVKDRMIGRIALGPQY